MTDPREVGYALLLAVGRLNRWASHRSTFTVPTAQLRLLALIDQLEPVRVGTLAVADHSSQPSITAQLNKTESSGWTARTTDPDDGRAQIVTLTGEGRAALEEARTIRAAALAPTLSEWPVERLEALSRAVAVLDELMQQLESEGTSA